MAFVLQVTSGDTEIDISGADPQVLTLPSAYSTAAGDCIVIGLTCSGTVTFVPSGCGATWVVVHVDSAPTAAILIGYGCTAGGTTVSIAGMSGQVGNIQISVWGGVLSGSTPITGTVTATSGAVNVASLTTPSLSYSAGELIIGSGHTGGAGFGFSHAAPSVWSDGATNTVVGIDNGSASARPVRVDYEVTAATSSTTYQAIIGVPSIGSTKNMRAIAVALSGPAGQQVLIV